jgi:hypothetical protein
MLDSVTLVNQLDSKYWRWRIEWDGFFDAVNEVSPSSIVDLVKHGVTNEAYAPRPTVLETIRKGRSLGKGSNCDYLWVSMLVNEVSH